MNNIMMQELILILFFSFLIILYFYLRPTKKEKNKVKFAKCRHERVFDKKSGDILDERYNTT
jgi:preprotein translocase subunit YajC